MISTPTKQAPTRRSDLKATIHLSKDPNHQNEHNHAQKFKIESFTPHKRSSYPKTQSTPKRSLFVPAPDRLLRVEGLEALRVNRARLMDWFMEIFAVFGIGWQGFWLTVQLLDSLIVDHSALNLDNLHLSALTCVFIAGKFVGRQLSLKEIVEDTGHNLFSRKDILKREGEIISLIFSNGFIQRYTFYHYVVEEFADLDKKLLGKVLRLGVVSLCRPDFSLIQMGVSTYKQLARLLVEQVSLSRSKVVQFLNGIELHLKVQFGLKNLSKFCNKMRVN